MLGPYSLLLSSFHDDFPLLPPPSTLTHSPLTLMLFFVACYFFMFLRSWASLLLLKCSSDLKYGPCPPARDGGRCLSGKIFFLFSPSICLVVRLFENDIFAQFCLRLFVLYGNVYPHVLSFISFLFFFHLNFKDRKFRFFLVFSFHISLSSMSGLSTATTTLTAS